MSSRSESVMFLTSFAVIQRVILKCLSGICWENQICKRDDRIKMTFKILCDKIFMVEKKTNFIMRGLFLVGCIGNERRPQIDGEDGEV